MRVGGRLGLVNQLRLLATRGRYRRDAVLIIKGTIPAEQGHGYLTLLSRELHRNLRAGGYRALRSTFVERDNPASAAQYRRTGGRPLHGYTFYRAGAGDVGRGVAAPGSELSGARPAPTTPSHGSCATATDEVAAGIRPGALPDSDPTGRDLFLSLGAFVETCLIVAADAGLPVRPDRAPGRTKATSRWSGRARSGRVRHAVHGRPTSRRAVGPRAATRPAASRPRCSAELGAGLAARALQRARADGWPRRTGGCSATPGRWRTAGMAAPVPATPALPPGRADRPGPGDVPSRGERGSGGPCAASRDPVLRGGLPAQLAAAAAGCCATTAACSCSALAGGERTAGGSRPAGACSGSGSPWPARARRAPAEPAPRLPGHGRPHGPDRVGALPLAVFRVGRPRAEPVRSARLPAG